MVTMVLSERFVEFFPVPGDLRPHRVDVLLQELLLPHEGGAGGLWPREANM